MRLAGHLGIQVLHCPRIKRVTSVVRLPKVHWLNSQLDHLHCVSGSIVHTSCRPTVDPGLLVRHVEVLQS